MNPERGAVTRFSLSTLHCLLSRPSTDMPVHVLDHPLAAHILTHLRDKTTKPATFRTLAYQLSLLLAIEATGDIETEDKRIETPLESMAARVLARVPLVVVPILRAGLGMV